MKHLLSFWRYVQENASDFGLGIVLMVVSMILARALYVLTKRVIAKHTKDPLLWILLADVFWLLSMLGGLALSVQVGFGINITRHIFVSAGILSVVMGFAFKELGENFVAGFMLAVRPPFAMDDYIEYEDTIGRVCEISLRAVRVITPDGKEVYIPSANLINNKFASLTFMPLLRYDFDLPLAPGFDFKQLEQVAIKAAADTSDVVSRNRRAPSVHIMSAKSRYMVMVRVFFWIDTHVVPTVTEHMYIRSHVIYNVLKALKEHGIELTSETYHVQMGAVPAPSHPEASMLRTVTFSEGKAQ